MGLPTISPAYEATPTVIEEEPVEQTPATRWPCRQERGQGL